MKCPNFDHILKFSISINFILICLPNESWSLRNPEYEAALQQILNPVKYEYYTENNPTTSDADLTSPIKSGQKIHFIIHGFDITFEGLQKARELKDVILKRDDVQAVVVLDWGSASRDYKLSLSNVVHDIKKELDRLHKNGVMEYKDVHMTGMSLGAHVAGQVGKAIRKDGNLIGRINGLDPSSYFFGSHKPKDTLMKGDADFVWILHTNSDRYGIAESLGDEDYFVNGGRTQPQCEDSWWKEWATKDACSHGAVWDYAKDYEAGKELPSDKPPVPSTSKSLPSASILVLDVSPSMQDHSRMTNLISAASQFIKSFKLGNYLGIVQFGGYARVTVPMTLVKDDTVRKSMLNGLPTPSTSIGATSIGAGLRAAVGQLKPLIESKTIRPCPQIILISDGEENTSPYIANVQSEVSALCGKIDAFAMGAASKDLEQLATTSNGSTFSVRDDGPGISDSLLNNLQSSQDSQISRDERPIRLPPKQTIIDGQTPTNFLIDKEVGKDTKFFVSTPLFNQVKATLTSPEEQIFSDFVKDPSSKGLSFELPEAPSGNWSLKLNMNQERRKKRSNDVQYNYATTFVTTFAKSNQTFPVRLEPYLSYNTLTDGNPVTITAHVRKGVDPVIHAQVLATLVSLQGKKLELELWDNGVGADALKNDGIYSRFVNSLPEEGRWQISVEALNTGESKTCQRPIEDIDNFYLSAGELTKISKCPLVDPFERQTEIGSIKVVGRFNRLPPGQIKDLRVLGTNLKNKIVKLSWTASGNEADNGTADYLILSATKYFLSDNNFTSFSELPKYKFGIDQIKNGSLDPAPAGQVQIVQVVIPDELWTQNGIDDEENSLFLFSIQSVTGTNNYSMSDGNWIRTSEASNIAIASFQQPHHHTSKNDGNSKEMKPFEFIMWSLVIIVGGSFISF